MSSPGLHGDSRRYRGGPRCKRTCGTVTGGCFRHCHSRRRDQSLGISGLLPVGLQILLPLHKSRTGLTNPGKRDTRNSTHHCLGYRRSAGLCHMWCCLPARRSTRWAPLSCLMCKFVAGVWVVGGPDTCIQLVTVELVRRECKCRGDLEEDQGGGEGLKENHLE